MTKRSGSSAPGGPVGRKERRTVRSRRIDFSDIPELSTRQLRAMRRIGRPPLGDEARHLIAIRIDPQVLTRLKKEASRRNIGYQTLINEVLARYARNVA